MVIRTWFYIVLLLSLFTLKGSFHCSRSPFLKYIGVDYQHQDRHIRLKSSPMEVERNDNCPKERRILSLPGSFGLASFSPSSNIKPTIIRILQFNVLADGFVIQTVREFLRKIVYFLSLSGLSPSKGYFTRIDPVHLDWEYRKSRLLNEITQYDPDIITLQEVDHYYDYFFSEFNHRGALSPSSSSHCHIILAV